MKKKSNNSVQRFEEKIYIFCKKYSISKASKILISFSGGSDSLSLLIALKNLGFENLMALYVNHHLRSNEELNKELSLNKDNASLLDIPLTVIDLARKEIDSLVPKLGLEGACRKLRYDKLNNYAIQNHFECIFTGHNQTDCDEEDIIQFFRGQSEFLSIREKIGILYRPLLDIPHDKTIEYVVSNGFEYSQDSTNYDNLHLRSQIRMKLKGVLDEVFPSFSNSFSQRRKLASKKDIKNEIYSAFRLINIKNSNNSRITLKDVNSIVDFAQNGNSSGCMDYCDAVVFRLTRKEGENRYKDLVVSRKDLQDYTWQTPLCKSDVLNNRITLANGEEYLIFKTKIHDAGLFSFFPSNSFVLGSIDNVVFTSFSPQDVLVKSGKSVNVKEIFKSSSVPQGIRKLIPVIKENGKCIALIMNTIGKKNYFSDDYKKTLSLIKNKEVFLFITNSGLFS